jgi:hypothetical protein
MKKLLFLLLSLVMILGTVIPIATSVAADTYSMVYLGMNETVPGSPFVDDRVREAVYIALDRDTIAASLGGEKIVSIAEPSVINPSVNRAQDLEYAKDLLASAGYPNGFTTHLYTTTPMVPLANIIRNNLLLVGVNATAVALEPAIFFYELQNKNLPFFLTATPVDSAVPQELLGRLLLKDGAQNYTGYETNIFELLYGQGRYRDAEIFAFDSDFPYSMPIIPLFWKTPFYTIRVGAACDDGSAANVHIEWSKTGGMPAYSGEGTTFFPIYQAGGNVTLTAPSTYIQGIKSYQFKEWLVGSPPAPPDVTTTDLTVTFTANASKLATARYELIIPLDSIYPLRPDVNPVGIEHTVWVNISMPIEGVEVMFNIDGANSGASGRAYTDNLGTAAFTYTGINPGMDVIFAYIDKNGNGEWDYMDTNENNQLDPDEPHEPRTVNTTSKNWVENFVTGGGNYKDDNDVTWEFQFIDKLMVLPEGGAAGHFQIIRHGDEALTYNIDQIEMLSFTGGETGSPPASNNTVRLRGTGTGSDGSEVMLLVVIEDVDKGKDKIAIVEVTGPPPPAPPVTIPWIGDIPTGTPPLPSPTLETIRGGSFQIHDVKAPVPAQESSPSRIILVKQTDPADPNGDYRFPIFMSYGALVGYPIGMQIVDDFQVDSGYILMPGIYTIIESPATGWILASLDIDDPTGDSYIRGSKAFINLASGETVIVTYYNSMNP